MGSSCDFLHFDCPSTTAVNGNARTGDINDEASESGLVHNEEFASRANSKFIQTESVFWGDFHVSEASPSP